MIKEQNVKPNDKACIINSLNIIKYMKIQYSIINECQSIIEFSLKIYKVK
jgi:hypothetical protein